MRLCRIDFCNNRMKHLLVGVIVILLIFLQYSNKHEIYKLCLLESKCLLSGLHNLHHNQRLHTKQQSLIDIATNQKKNLTKCSKERLRVRWGSDSFEICLGNLQESFNIYLHKYLV